MRNSDRLAWADTAKGICIILVVLVHVHHKNYLQLDWDLSVPVERVWSAANLVLTPMRVPLFFTISGMLAASALARPWKMVVSSKVGQPAYLYVLWVTVAVALYTLLGSSIDDIAVRSPLDYLALILIPSSTLWYLYALALYFVIAKIFRGVSAWGVAGAAGLVSLLAFEFAGDGVPARIAQNLIFFVAAAYFPHVIRRVGEVASLRVAVSAVVAYGAVVGVYLLEMDGLMGVRTIAAFVAVWAGISVISPLARLPRFAAAVGYVGRNTLPIYVMHVPMLAIFAWLTADKFGGTSLLLAAIYPLVLAAGLVAACLLLRSALLAVRAGWLLSLPRFSARPARNAETAPTQ